MQLFRLREKFASYEPKSRDDSAGKKTGNTFVNTQLPSKELDRRQLGLEYDQDVTNDDEYIKKIFDTNAYHHDLKRPREYKASPVRREHMALQKAKEPSGFSSTGNFPAFTATFSDNAQGKGLDNTLGIYALTKLGNRSYDIEGFTQEEFFLIKLRWLIRMAKGEVETNKRNLNNLRITIEKIIEEASPAFNIELFQDQKKVKVLLKKLTLLLVKVDAQKAILLSYKLFKMHIKQLDLQDPESKQEVATKLYSFFIPYTDLLEAKLSKRGALQKKKANLVTYRKIRNLCLRNDIAAILKEYPNPKAGQDYAARFKAFLREKTTLDKALAGLIPKSQRLSTNDSLTAENNNVVVGSLDDLDAPMPAEMFGSQSGFENAKSIDLDEKNDIGIRLNYSGSRLNNQVIPIELLESMKKSVTKPSPKITSHLKHSNLGISTKSHHKHEQMEKQIQELMDDPELYQSPEDSEDSFTKGKENINTNNNMLKPQPVQHKFDVLTRGVSSRDELNLRTGQTNIPQRMELVKMNSSQNPPLKETVHQPQRESTFKKSSMKSSILAKDLNMSVTKKEIVFQKVISIAYDNVSKWDNVTNSATIKIDKIKPENSPVVLLKAWAIVEGFTPKEVFEQIYDTTQRAKWDTVTVDLQVVEALGNNSEVIYFYIKTPFGITERDFVQKRDYIFDYPEKDTIVMSFQSCTHPAKPPLKKRIRGETHIAGYVIKPSITKPHSTDLCILSQVDIKGQVPKAIVNLVAGKAPAEWVSKLRKACERTRMGKH